MKCGGDANQRCGGDWALSVTRRSTTGTTAWTSAGCYTDSSSRALRSTYVDQAGMTTEKCVDICSSTGYSMAATEYGRECMCGNQLFKENGSGVARPASECGMNCSGRFGQRLTPQHLTDDMTNY